MKNIWYWYVAEFFMAIFFPIIAVITLSIELGISFLVMLLLGGFFLFVVPAQFIEIAKSMGEIVSLGYATHNTGVGIITLYELIIFYALTVGFILYSVIQNWIKYKKPFQVSPQF